MILGVAENADGAPSAGRPGRRPSPSAAAADARPSGPRAVRAMSASRLRAKCAAAGALGERMASFLLARRRARSSSRDLRAAGLDRQRYAYLAGYTVLQYVVLADRLEHSRRLCGLREFRRRPASSRSASYTSVVVYKTLRLPLLLVHSRARQLVAGLLGLGMGYLTLRLRGVFFSIATLAFRSCCKRWW